MSDKSFFSLAAQITVRGSAELLDTGDIIRLAESCEAPTTDAGAYRWTQEFALPLIRELGNRLERSHTKSSGDVQTLLALARAMRTAQRAYVTDKSASNNQAAKVAEHRFDMQLANRQMPLWSQESADEPVS